MAVTPPLVPEVLTSKERWRRWEQRGQDTDARFMRRVRGALWMAGAAAAGLGGILLVFLALS